MRKSDVFIEEKTSEKGNRKSNSEGKDVRGNSKVEPKEIKIYNSAEEIEEKMVENEVENPIEHHVYASTASITENLTRHEFLVGNAT